MKPSFSLVLLCGVALLMALAIFNSFTVLTMDSKMEEKISQIMEANRPATIQLTIIQPVCDGCTDVSALVDEVKQSNINLTSERAIAAKDAISFISKYSITRLPAIILEGEITRISAKDFETREHALVYDQVAPPYYSILSKKIEGKVDAWVIDAPQCEKCPDMRDIIGAFTDQGVFFTSTSALNADDPQAISLIAANHITKLPALMLSEGISAYPEILQAMAKGGFTKSANVHVYESPLPFYNFSSGIVRGFVDVIFVNDSGCVGCYDVKIHNQILSRFGLAIGLERTVDFAAAEGKKIVQEYGITSLPAVILTGDVGMYSGFEQLWLTVGSVEEDGSYVFRSNGALGGLPYKNLTTGEMVRAQKAAG